MHSKGHSLLLFASNSCLISIPTDYLPEWSWSYSTRIMPGTGTGVLNVATGGGSTARNAQIYNDRSFGPQALAFQ
ncbi:hypothetical protein GCM10023333_22300 [Ferrimonas pelagia]|uniref:Uncharacterized protein n=1 Tax=Ferrimonas pelagia TaxID=1177826 RepID=A0ABP9EYE9_9GAMM